MVADRMVYGTLVYLFRSYSSISSRSGVIFRDLSRQQVPDRSPETFQSHFNGTYLYI